MWKPPLWLARCIPLLTMLCGIAAAQQIPSSAPVVVAAVAPQWAPFGIAIKQPKEQSSKATATVEVTIDEKGIVTAVKLLKGHPLFVKVSLDAAKQWRFAPGESGRIAQLTFTFVVFNRGTPDAQLGTIFHPPYEIEVRVELPESSVLP